MKLNKIDEVWSCANSLFKWRSRFVLIPWQRDLTTSPLQWVHRKILSPVSQVRKGRRRVGARNSRNKANMAKYKVVTFAPVIALATLSYERVAKAITGAKVTTLYFAMFALFLEFRAPTRLRPFLTWETGLRIFLWTHWSGEVVKSRCHGIKTNRERHLKSEFAQLQTSSILFSFI